MFRRVGGIFFTTKDVQGLEGWDKVAKWADRVGKVLEATPFLFGGVVRDWLFSKLQTVHTTPEGKDFDILLKTNYDVVNALKVLAGEYPHSLLMVVAEDTFRIQEGKVKIDFKVTTDVEKTAFDYTINAALVSLNSLLDTGKSEVFVYNLSDFEDKVLRHIAPLRSYPFHILRGIRLASEYGLVFNPQTLKALQSSITLVRALPEPLVHRELAKSVTRGYERVFPCINVTRFLQAFYTPAAEVIKKKPDLYAKHLQRCIAVFSLFNPKNTSAAAKDVRRVAPARILQRTFAPADRNLLYCYYTASVLALSSMASIQDFLTEKNYYPAERGVITLCVASLQGKVPFERAHTLVKPLLYAWGKAGGG